MGLWNAVKMIFIVNSFKKCNSEVTELEIWVLRSAIKKNKFLWICSLLNQLSKY